MICKYQAMRSVGQAVKTPPSHGGNRGSIPLRTALLIVEKPCIYWVFPLFLCLYFLCLYFFDCLTLPCKYLCFQFKCIFHLFFRLILRIYVEAIISECFPLVFVPNLFSDLVYVYIAINQCRYIRLSYFVHTPVCFIQFLTAC